MQAFRKKGRDFSLKPAEMLIHALDLAADAAVVVHNPSNMFYLSAGYTGEGVVYISRKTQAIITDFRYTEQAEQQAPTFRCVMTEKGMSHDQWVAKLAQEDGVSVFYYEDDYLTVKAFQALRDAIGDGATWLPLAQKPEKLREIKSEDEIRCIREACRITSEAFLKVLPEIHEGMTEKELAIRFDYLQLELGAQGNSFSTICASGENGSLPHAIPGNRKLRKGDMITLDVGCKVGGYCSDMTRTVAVGEPTDEMRRVYDTVLKAQLAGIAAAHGGVTGDVVHNTAAKVIADAGYGEYFGHGFGHSLGIEIHENPRFSPFWTQTIPSGATLSAEPGIYLPGKFGVRIEDVLWLTDEGCVDITASPKDLIIL